MNILYVLHKDPDVSLGGVERHTFDLARSFSAEGCKTHMLFPSSSSMVIATFTETGIKKKRMKGKYSDEFLLKDESLNRSFTEILENLSVDIVHFQHLLGFPLSLIESAKKYGAKVFVNLHDYYLWCPSYKLMSPVGRHNIKFCFFKTDISGCALCLETLYKKSLGREAVIGRREYARKMLLMADRLVFPSQYLMDIMLSLFKLSSETAGIIEPGVDGPCKIPSYSPNGSLKAAYLGAFTHEKGACEFIELAHSVNNSPRAKDVSFHIIGELGYPLPAEFNHCRTVYASGAYRPGKLSALLAKEGIDIVLLLPVWPETYSYTLSEAIVNGIPVISSDLGALRDRVSRHAVGYLVPHEDPVPHAARIINDFLDHPELLAYFRKQCSAAAKQLPNVSQMAKRYMESYRAKE